MNSTERNMICRMSSDTEGLFRVSVPVFNSRGTAMHQIARLQQHQHHLLVAQAQAGNLPWETHPHCCNELGGGLPRCLLLLGEMQNLIASQIDVQNCRTSHSQSCKNARMQDKACLSRQTCSHTCKVISSSCDFPIGNALSALTQHTKPEGAVSV